MSDDYSLDLVDLGDSEPKTEPKKEKGIQTSAGEKPTENKGKTGEKKVKPKERKEPTEQKEKQSYGKEEIDILIKMIAAQDQKIADLGVKIMDLEKNKVVVQPIQTPVINDLNSFIHWVKNVDSSKVEVGKSIITRLQKYKRESFLKDTWNLIEYWKNNKEMVKNV